MDSDSLVMCRIKSWPLSAGKVGFSTVQPVLSECMPLDRCAGRKFYPEFNVPVNTSNGT